MVTSARFFRGRNLVNIKCILSNLTCVLCKEFYFCILGRSIILFGGDLYLVETSQLICIVSMQCEIFQGGISEHHVIFSGFFI